MARMRRFKQSFAYLHGWFESESSIYLAMDYFPLGDLSRHLDRSFPEDEVQSIAGQLLSGLKAMHDLGFTHRDLKPQNIFVVKKCPPAWNVRIGDFGISKRVLGTETDLRTLTGTAAYMAPEMFPYLIDDDEEHSYTQLVDIWALGVVLYQLFTLQTPFNALNPMSKFFKGRSEFPEEPLLSRRVTSLGIEFVQLLLHPRPAERLTSKLALDHSWLQTAPHSEPDRIPSPSADDADGSVDVITRTTVDFSQVDPICVSTEGPEMATPIGDIVESAVVLPPSQADPIIAHRTVPTKTKVLSQRRGPDEDGMTRVMGMNHGISVVALSPDGSLMLTGSRDEAVDMWLISDGTHVQDHKLRSTAFDGGVKSIAFSPSGDLVAILIRNGDVKLWSASEWIEVATLRGLTIGSWSNEEYIAEVSNPSTVMAFSPDSRTLATSCGFSVLLWDLKDMGKVKLRIEGHAKQVGGIAFSQNGRLIASSSEDKTVAVWDAKNGARVSHLKNRTGSISAMAFSPDGMFLMSGSFTTGRIWDIATETEVRKFDHLAEITALVFSPVSDLVAFGLVDGTIHLWNWRSRAKIRRFEAGRKRVCLLAFSRRGRMLLFGNEAGLGRLRVDEVQEEPVKNVRRRSYVRHVTGVLRWLFTL